MKPFFTNEILFTATENELAALRVCVANFRNRLLEKGNNEVKDWEFHQREIDFHNKLYEDLTHIIEMLPF